MTRQDGKALVLFSGGQDSATCLAWALERFSLVETIGFSYGQRHAVEMDVRQAFLRHLKAGFPAWAARLGEDQIGAEAHLPRQLREIAQEGLEDEILVPVLAVDVDVGQVQPTKGSGMVHERAHLHP